MPFGQYDYETIAASQTAQVMGPTSGTTKAVGTQYLSHLMIIPATTAPGAVSIKDGADSAITVFTGGTVSDISTKTIAIKAWNKTGSWQITTGSNVSAIAFGRFT